MTLTPADLQAINAALSYLQTEVEDAAGARAHGVTLAQLERTRRKVHALLREAQ
jgi:hypothetical protein